MLFIIGDNQIPVLFIDNGGGCIPVTFNEALKELLISTRNTQAKRIKLVNGEVLEGNLLNVQQEMLEISMPKSSARFGRRISEI